MKLNLVCKILIAAFALAACEEFGNSLLEMKSDAQINHKEVASEQRESTQLAKNILEIFEDSQGNIWFGTTNEGVIRLNSHKEKVGVEEELITHYSMQDGLCGSTVADIIEDDGGTLWFGTHSDMCRVSINSVEESKAMKFLPFESNDTIPKLGYGWKNVKKDRSGGIWINTHQGIFKYQNQEFVEFKVPTSRSMRPSYCNTPGGVAMYLLDSNGNYWFGTDGDGAFKFDPIADRKGKNAFTHYAKSDGLSSDFVNGILEDKNGDIWFTCAQDLNNPAGDGGVCRFNISDNVDAGDSFTKFREINGLYGNNIHTIYEDKIGNIWIGAPELGVYRYDIEDEGIEESKKFHLFRSPKGIPAKPGAYTNGLQSILEDSKGRMWCGFSGGLYRLEDHQREDVGNGNYFVNVTKAGPWL